MINLILVYLIIQIYSIFFSIKFKKNIGNTFVISILSIIAIIYLFGLLNILPFGVYFVELASLGLLIYEIKYFIKNKDKLKTTIINKENVIFTTLFIGLSLIHQGRMLSEWDEFSHWGDVVKAMFTINDFSTDAQSMSAFQSYPPAMSIFQYFFVKVGNTYNESNLYIAYQVMFLSLIMPFISKNKKVFDSVIMSIIFMLVPIIITNKFYTSIYIDTILGLLFGYILSTIMVNEYDKYQYINLCLSLFTLILLKDVGMFLALIAIAMIATDLIFVKKKVVFCKDFYKKNKKYIWIILASVIAVLVAKFTWNLDIKINDAEVAFSNKITFKEIINLITFRNLGYRATVISNFAKNLYNENIINSIVNFNTITLSIVFMILLLLGLNKQKKSKYYIGCIMGGLAIYVAGLAFIYCFKFTEYEAVRLASYSRYISIYMIAVLFVIAAVIINQKEKTIPLLLILLFVPYNSLLGIRYTVGESVDFREPYESAIDAIDEKIDDDDKVYIISQNTSGYDYWVLRYTLRPNMINEASTWSIGTKYGEEDIWTKEFTQEEWMDKLVEDDYDFVYLYKCDNQFKDEFQSLFVDASDIDERSLFKVETETRKLELVE